ncbi:MAG TPA: DUF167 domain-containing protein [Pirellulales bacterium]|nr:DUF167 domain-containing protein [Pirellulales bacterium]
MTLDIQKHADGAILPVHAKPGSRTSGLRGVRAGALSIAVVQVAEKGKANTAIAELLARELGLRPGQIELVAGSTSPAKRFLVRGLTPAELAARLAPLLARKS